MSTNQTRIRPALFLLALLPLAGACSSVGYGDAQAEETLTIDWGSTDKQTFAKHMVQSLIDSPALSYLVGPGKGDDPRVIAYMGKVSNETSEHINTTMITDSIRTELLQSGKFRFAADDAGQDQLADQVRFQQGSGRVDPDMAKAFGRQLGVDVIVYGALRSIEKEKGRSLETLGSKRADTYYQFVLNAVNVETAELIWSNEEEIRKTSVTGLFGR